MISFYIYVIGCFLLYGFAFHMLFTALGNRLLNQLLALLMFARGSQSLYFILVESGQLEMLKHLFKVFNFFYFAAPACSYLYFKTFLRGNIRLNKWEWLHFMPLLIPLTDLISWNLIEDSSQQRALLELQNNHTVFIQNSVGLLSYQLSLFICTILFLIYLMFSARMLLAAGVLSHRKKNRLANNWLLFLYGFLFSVQLVRLLPFVTKYLLGLEQADQVVYQYYINGSSIILFSAIVFILYNPKILYGYVFISKDFTLLQKEGEKKRTVDGEEIPALEKSVLQEKSKGNPSAALQKNLTMYEEKIREHMELKKPYLHPDFSINRLASDMNIPIHYCSYIVNYSIGKNFREWVNGYRIAHFIREYPLQIKSKTILTLSMECGFKNKNTFYSAFKNVMGVSPSEYF